MKFKFNDGGRAAAGYKGFTGDCVCRAIAIATERPYKEVYDLINKFSEGERKGKRKRGKSNARTGVYKPTIKKVMDHYGWKWVPTMQIGQGCTTHLRDGELPMGRLVVNVSKHCTAVIDGVINDTYDPSRDGNRCVYGYFTKDEPPKAEPKPAKKQPTVIVKTFAELFSFNNAGRFFINDADCQRSFSASGLNILLNNDAALLYYKVKKFSVSGDDFIVIIDN